MAQFAAALQLQQQQMLLAMQQLQLQMQQQSLSTGSHQTLDAVPQLHVSDPTTDSWSTNNSQWPSNGTATGFTTGAQWDSQAGWAPGPSENSW
jgi:hypothetical protein